MNIVIYIFLALGILLGLSIVAIIFYILIVGMKNAKNQVEDEKK